jgi:hypothetical protein
MLERDILIGVAIAAFNAPVIVFVKKLVGAIDLKHITSEKPNAPVAAPAPADGQDADPNAALPGSSSRVVAVIASIILACFLWGAGNYVIFAAFFEPDKIQGFLNALTGFFIPGMTLYAPYSVNKLTSVFKN